MRILTLVAAISLAGSQLAAQAAKACPTKPFFEFQVDEPAAFVRDTASPVYPQASGERAPANLVEFIVDTAGVADTASLKVLRAADRALINEVRAALPRWRFVPARVGSCKVIQLFQTPVVKRPQ
jgi:hypothetical protein